jgi:hypothetical protein
MPAITCVFVGMVATLVSSCARNCEAVYAQRPAAGVDYGSGPGFQPYAQPPGSYPSGPPPAITPYEAPPGSYPYEPQPGTS